MPVHYPDADSHTAVFHGSCAPEEADALLEWLRRTPDPCADLSGCADLHTAVAQLLLAANVLIVARSADPMLAGCLGTGAVTANAFAAAPARDGCADHESGKRKRRRPPNNKARP